MQIFILMHNFEVIVCVFESYTFFWVDWFDIFVTYYSFLLL